MKFISRQRVIGVCCEGVNLGRLGKLCWLVVSKPSLLIVGHTLIVFYFLHCSFFFIIHYFSFQIGCSKVIYLFDVLTLGAPCFDEGLQDILESGDILKVFDVYEKPEH